MKVLKIKSNNLETAVVLDFATAIITKTDNTKIELLVTEEVVRTVTFLGIKPPKDYDKVEIVKTETVDFNGRFFKNTLKNINFNEKLYKDYLKLYIQSCFSYKSMVDAIDNFNGLNTQTLINAIKLVANSYGVKVDGNGFMEITLGLSDIKLKTELETISLLVSLTYEITNFSKNLYYESVKNGVAITNPFAFGY